EIIRSRGFTIDLPKDIPLVRTRMTISHKEKYLPLVQRAIASLCLKAMARIYCRDGLLPPGLSEDYFKDRFFRDKTGIFDNPTPELEKEARDKSVRSEFTIAKEAEFINNDQLHKISFNRYLVRDTDKEKMQELKHRSLKYLLTLIEIKDEEGKTFSLSSKRKEFLKALEKAHQKGEMPEIEEITEELSLDVESGIIAYLNKAASLLNAEFVSRENPEEIADTKGDKALRDFGELIRIVLSKCGLGDIEVEFYRKAEPIVANFGFGLLRYNLYHVDIYVDILQGILNSGITEPVEIYDFFRTILDYTAHEGVHFFDEKKASHESAEELVGLFAWRQKELIRQFIKSGISWDDILPMLAESPEGPSSSTSSSPGTQHLSGRGFLVKELAQNAIDVKNVLYVMNKLIPAQLEAGKVYEIRYDSARLREYQMQTGINPQSSPEQLLKEYVKHLQLRVQDGKPEEVIDLKEFDGETDKGQSLISIICYEDIFKGKIVGKGNVNIKDLDKETAIRIIAMLNMALAASNIPIDAELAEYGSLVSFVQNQYKAITDEELSPEDIQHIIELPNVKPVSIEKLEEYYRLTIEQLRQAA
ncbi:MAG: hypothetical protein KAU58_01010, partial [Candidatus Omnitrophica bacterium]|nr:hypothetical protein [Candidatus Omnitrophota bacterium]